MAKLDLDARRAEYGEGHEVTLAGKAWELPPKFPMAIAQYLQAGELDKAVAALFGEDAVDTVLPVLNDDDLNAILGDLYGLNDDAAAKAASNGKSPRRK